MIDINITLVIQMANFLLREQGIERADADAASAVREFEEKVHEARNQGRQKVQEFKEAAYVNEKDLLREASEASAMELAEIRQKVKKDIAAARKRLRAQIQAFSIDVAQKVLGRSV
jgi:F-type H+-transporting ATPase subunit b